MKRKLIIKISLGILAFLTISNVGGLIAFNTMFRHYNFNESDYKGLRYEDIENIKYFKSEVTYKSNKETLKGNIYFNPVRSNLNPNLVVISNGLHSCQEEYISIIKYFRDNNYDVFTFDNSGNGDSTGKAYGFCQATIDLEYTLKYINENYLYYTNINLFGFSLGGYATTSILNTYTNINSVASISGFNNGKKIFGSIASNYAGFVSYTGLLFTSIKQKRLFKEYNNYTAVNGINNVDIPIFIAHSKDDKLIKYKKDSIAINKDNITNQNVTYYVVEGYDHSEILYSNEANTYRKSLNNSQDVDRYLYSQINQDLFDNIIDFYNLAI